MNYFMIASYKNPGLYMALRRELNQRGHFLTHDWLEATGGRKRENFSEGQRHLLELDLQGITQANIVLYLAPGGNDSFIEFGAALVAGKMIIVVGPENFFPEASHFNHSNVILFRHPAFASRHTVACMLADSLEVKEEE